MIARSVSYTKIESAPYDADLAHELSAQCDDDVHDEGRQVHEYWGTTDSGSVWRVHLTDAPE